MLFLWVIFFVSGRWMSYGIPSGKSHLGNLKYLPPLCNNFFSTWEIGEINRLWFWFAVLTQRTVKIHSTFLENRPLSLLEKRASCSVNPQLKATLVRYQAWFLFLFLMFLWRIRRNLPSVPQMRDEDYKQISPGAHNFSPEENNKRGWNTFILPDVNPVLLA